MSRKFTRISLTGEEKHLIAKRKVETGQFRRNSGCMVYTEDREGDPSIYSRQAVRAGFDKLELETPEAKRQKRHSPKWPLLDKGVVLSGLC